jgi:peptide deformylase
MPIREITCLDQPQLRAINQPITEFNDTLQTLINDMFDTMYAAKGIGLAAPQVGVNQQLAVIDVTTDRSETWCLINPKITWREGEALLEEGCLSIPGAVGKVPRSLKVKLQALDRNGKPFEIEADGLLAHCIQHELDHLAGKLFIDYLSPLKQQRALRKFQKMYRRPARSRS